ncbi:MAG: tRNA guanosine(34) transglycosylase Tgt [Parcubacteria group bacterium]|nr:tRNA guanosine(34) transglycosylase Tgt [Parcubacteria group bacterium]
MMFKVLKKDAGSRARLGVLETPHGAVETPGYVVVGTHAQVRELSPKDLEKTKTQIIIANTYHLWQALGDAGLKKYSGLHQEMNWRRPLMTDSGGFQVFSLGFARELGIGKVATRVSPLATRENLVRITDDGVYFHTEKGDQYLDAKKSIWIQERLGADIILAFDEPTSPLHDYQYNQTALERTHRWAKESLKAKTSNQFLYGIVQGGLFEDLRRASAEFIGSMDFDGLAVGGSFGSAFGGQSKNFQELDWVVPHLPENKPRHLLGIGLVEDLFMGVAKGIDTFDCVVPTREGRHGNLYTSPGEINIHRGLYRDDVGLIDPECECEVCAVKKTSRGRLRQLFKDKNSEAGYLASFHNVYFFNNLMNQIRQAIAEDRFGKLMAERLARRG